MTKVKMHEKLQITGLVLFLAIIESNLFAQSVIIRGSIICYEHGDEDLHKPANLVIVCPEEYPEFAVISKKNGFYSIKLPQHVLESTNFELNLLFISKNKWIGNQKVLIPREIGHRNEDIQLNAYTQILNKPCEFLEKDYGKVRSELDSLMAVIDSVKVLKSRQRKKSYTGALIKIIGGGGLLGIISTLGSKELGSVRLIPRGKGAAIPGDPPCPPICLVDSVLLSTPASIKFSPRKNKIGDFLSTDAFSGDIGFAFSPLAIFDRTVFSNSSAMLRSSNSRLNLRTNIDKSIVFSPVSGLFQLSFFVPVNNEAAFGFGYLSLKQSENRTAFIDTLVIYQDSFDSEEQAFIIAAAWRLGHQFSLGMSGKYLGQSMVIPKVNQNSFEMDEIDEVSILDVEESETYVDFDLSATMDLNNSLNVGVSLMHIAGTKLFRQDLSTINIRTLGMGLSYESSYLDVGSDIKWGQGNRIDFALGLRYRPLTETSIGLGLSSEFDTFAFTATFEFLSYTFNKSRLIDTYHYVGLNFRL